MSRAQPPSPTPQAAWVAVAPRGWMALDTVADTRRAATRKLSESYTFGKFASLTLKDRWGVLRAEGWTMQRIALVGLSAFHDLQARAVRSV